MLSRLPSQNGVTDQPEELEISVFNISQLDNLPVTQTQIRQATRKDSILSQVLTYTKSGWPTSVSEEMKPFFIRQNELTVQNDCHIRILVPNTLRKKVLIELHSSHVGMSRMKSLARSYVWWPRLDKDIEKSCKSCLSCLAVKSSPPSAPLHPWSWPSRPWQRVHVDFAGPFMGFKFLLLVDLHSKWPEVYKMSSITTQNTIAILRHIFFRMGYRSSWFQIMVVNFDPLNLPSL